MIKRNIEARPVWEPMTKTKYLKKYPTMNSNTSLNIAKRIINLPSSAYLYKYFNFKKMNLGIFADGVWGFNFLKK